MRNQMTAQAENPKREEYEQFIQIQNNCTLCGSSLDFEYENKTQFKIVEKCSCPHCGLKGRERAHSLN